MVGFLRLLRVILILGLCFTVDGCLNDSECDDGYHCCKSHCTTSKIRCSQLCNFDKDCKRDHLCHLSSYCVACSERFNCALKTCFNDTDCPEDFECGKNLMCHNRTVAKRQTFTLLPFIIIIAVLGFALTILCYTEGCWKELFVYIKRHWGRYGTVALDEAEAQRREAESETSRHANKSSVDYERNQDVRNTTYSTRNVSTHDTEHTNSLQILRNTQVISHNSRTLVSTISDAIRSPSQASTNTNSIVTSSNLSGRNRDSGSEPLLIASQGSTSVDGVGSPPTYLSLCNEEYEEPPPKYEEVVNIVRVPVSIEMNAVPPDSNSRSSRSQDHHTEIETMV